MDANTQQVSEFEIVYPNTSVSTAHQIYTACKRFGVIVACQVFNSKLSIQFERTIHTDRLNPSHQLRIDNEELELKWQRDFHPNHLLQQLPELESSQQSPYNILEALNDDCLREIFVNLPVLDRCAVAHSCQRFRDVVLGVKSKHIKITSAFCTNPLWEIERFFRTLGNSIRTVEITVCCKCPDIIMVFLTRYCENIVDVKCDVMLRRNTFTELAALFPRLRRVFLRHCGTADVVLQPNDEIESIRVGDVGHLPPIHFPKLRELILRMEETCTLPSIKRFFDLNTRFEKLDVGYIGAIPLSDIAGKLPLLEQFQAGLELSADGINLLCQLKHLHSLTLRVFEGDIGKLLKTLVETDIQLKHLDLVNIKGQVMRNDVDYIIRMKDLEHLRLLGLWDDQLVRIVANCTKLKEIVIESNAITPREIRDALRCANMLEMATIDVRFYSYSHSRLIIDQCDAINAIDELRLKKRIKLKVSFHDIIPKGHRDEIEEILSPHKWIRSSFQYKW